MKKLMIAAAIVCAAVLSQAAALNWATDNNGLLDPSGNYAGGEGYITMYRWVIDSSTYTELTKGGEAAVGTAVWNAYGTKTGTATDSYADDGMGQIVLYGTESYSANDTVYQAILLTYNEGTGVTHYKGNVGTYTFDSDADITISGMDSFFGGDMSGSSTAVTWQTVPEPTSGLLLLLGVAGLALKRKRA